MINHFNFDLILQKLRIQIPSNIKYGIIFSKILSETDDKTIKVAVNQLKTEFKSGIYAQRINTEAKLDHVLTTLEKITQKKFHFDKANIDEAQKLNSFYYQANIETGTTNKKFVCSNCKISQFSTSSAFHSHMKNCRKPFMDVENIQLVRDGQHLLNKQKRSLVKQEKIKLEQNQFMDEQFASQSFQQIFEEEQDQ